MIGFRTFGQGCGPRCPTMVAAAVGAVGVLLAGCSSVEPEAAASAPESLSAGSMPSAHVHGVGIDPADGTLLMATHEGLFEVTEGGESVRVSPVIDLMGFAVSGPGHFLASGHPGPDVDLPQPVGLIESTDGGRTWQPVSRQGVSDFHALTVGEAGVLGYDGSLLRSSDGDEWEQVVIPAEPAALAAAPDGQSVLATTQQGLLSSSDGGATWTPIERAPLLQVVDWADDGTSVAGVDPSGQVWTSEDGARTWREGSRLASPPQAVAAGSSDEGSLRIVVVTTDALFESRDGGRTFDELLEL